MTDHADLAARLRTPLRLYTEMSDPGTTDLLIEAADALDDLTRERDDLRGALREAQTEGYRLTSLDLNAAVDERDAALAREARLRAVLPTIGRLVAWWDEEDPTAPHTPDIDFNALRPLLADPKEATTDG